MEEKLYGPNYKVQEKACSLRSRSPRIRTMRCQSAPLQHKRREAMNGPGPGFFFWASAKSSIIGVLVANFAAHHHPIGPFKKISNIPWTKISVCLLLGGVRATTSRTKSNKITPRNAMRERGREQIVPSHKLAIR